MTTIAILFYLIAAHFIIDYCLQTDTVAINKNINSNTELQKYVPWYYWLWSHAIFHGAAVAFITNSVVLGILETILHFIIDYGKCKFKYSIHIDQFLHIVCKIFWLILVFKI